jgi:hypothetical protein
MSHIKVMKILEGGKISKYIVRSKIIRKGGADLGPSLDQGRAKVGLRSARGRPIIGPSLGKPRSIL